MDGSVRREFEWRDGGECLVVECAGAGDVELRALATVAERYRKIQRERLVRGIARGDLQVGLHAAEFEIIGDHFGLEAETKMFEVCFDSLDGGFGSLRVPAGCTPKVQFPRSIESGAVKTAMPIPRACGVLGDL
jgi:hypothetical protein